jgi:phospholipid transport system substrate-binding protein
MTFLPFRGDLTTGQATVRTEVKRSDGTRVPVNYSMRATPAGWKAWDVTIEGISYVRNLRNDVGAEVDQRGLDAVIERLETESRRGDKQQTG